MSVTKELKKLLRGYKYISRKKEIEVERLPSNLKYYKTEFIPKFSEDEEILSSKLLDYIKEMVGLKICVRFMVIVEELFYLMKI